MYFLNKCHDPRQLGAMNIVQSPRSTIRGGGNAGYMREDTFTYLIANGNERLALIV